MSFSFNPSAYGQACESLIASAELCELGPGKPNQAVETQLRALDEATIFGNQSVLNHELASCCISGLWLLHNYLDRSHSISQDIATTTGSYWHGIMHRREPDFSNAKYWFRRVGEHEIFPTLCEAAGEIARQAGTDDRTEFLARQSMWNASAFVDLCEATIRGQAEEAVCRRVAQVEWELLFDHCYRNALSE